MTSKLKSISAISLLAAFSLSSSSCADKPKPAVKAQITDGKGKKNGHSQEETAREAAKLVKVAEDFAQGKVEINQLKTDFDNFKQKFNDIDVLADQDGHNFALLVASRGQSTEAASIIDQFLSQIDKTKLTLQLEQLCLLDEVFPATLAHFMQIDNSSYSEALANTFVQKAYDLGPKHLIDAVRMLDEFGITKDRKVYAIKSINNGPTHRGLLQTVLFSIADLTRNGDSVKAYFGEDDQGHKAYMNYVSSIFSATKPDDINSLALWAYENRDVQGIPEIFKAEYGYRSPEDKKALREKLFEQATYKDGIGDENTGAIAVVNLGFLPNSALNVDYNLDNQEGGLVDCIGKLVHDAPVGAQAALAGAVRLSLEKPDRDFESKREFGDERPFGGEPLPPFPGAPSSGPLFGPNFGIPGGPVAFPFNGSGPKAVPNKGSGRKSKGRNKDASRDQD